jgi:hypothetical protein
VLLVLAGTALVVLALTTLNWYVTESGVDTAGNGFRFDDLHHNVDQLGGVPVARAYFGWLAWTALGAVVAVGLAANVRTRLADGLRVLGFLLGVVGTLATYYAVDQLFHAVSVAGGSRSVWHNSTFGLWLALGGYLLAGLGASRGPFRERPDGSATIRR